jgi:hypothetical protein
LPCVAFNACRHTKGRRIGSGQLRTESDLGDETANITPRPLTVTATGVNKVYDGNTTAMVTLSDNRVAGASLQTGTPPPASQTTSAMLRR